MKRMLSLVILTVIFCFTSFSQSNSAACPRIKLILPISMLISERPAIFSVELEGNQKTYKLEYLWIISGGKITKGQRSSKIEFVPDEEDEGSDIGVAVKVKGLPKHCSDTASDFIGVIPSPIGEPIEAFGKIPLTNYKFRYYSFIHALRYDSPNSSGLIELKFDKRDARNYKVSVLKNIIKTLKFYESDLTRITIAISDGDYEQTELWIVPADVKFPKSRQKPYQRIAEENNQIIKAQELIQQINKLCL